MSINKNAFLRYQVLDKCFQNTSRRFFWEDLLYEVNKALLEFNGPESTIQRRQLLQDIKFMESDQGWSIPLERFREGKKVYYLYADKEFSINNQPLNEQEATKIQAALSVLSRFAGAPQFEWIQELIPILNDRLGLADTSQECIHLEANVDLKGINNLSTLYEAIIKQNVIEVEYKDFKSSEPFLIKFHPYLLKQYNSRWFVFGLNEYKSIPNWNLALDRIHSISSSRSTFIPSEIDWQDYFFDIVGVTKPIDQGPETVQLEVSDPSAPYVLTKPLHPSQKIIQASDPVIISIDVIPNYELESLILSYGENIKVKSPQHLRLRIGERAAKIAESYR